MSGYDNYSGQQGGYPGGGNIPQGGNYGGGGGYSNEDDDLGGAARHAEENAGDSADSSIFSSVLGMLGQKKEAIKDSDLDEQGGCSRGDAKRTSTHSPQRPFDLTSSSLVVGQQVQRRIPVRWDLRPPCRL